MLPSITDIHAHTEYTYIHTRTYLHIYNIYFYTILTEISLLSPFIVNNYKRRPQSRLFMYLCMYVCISVYIHKSLNISINSTLNLNATLNYVAKPLIVSGIHQYVVTHIYLYNTYIYIYMYVQSCRLYNMYVCIFISVFNNPNRFMYTVAIVVSV